MSARSKRVPMVEFRSLLSALGHTNIVTLLNSGNAVFRARSGTPRAHAARIAAAIAQKLKVEVPVIVKSARASLLRSWPRILSRIDAAQHSRFLVAFAQEPKSLAGLAVIESLVQRPERFAIGRYAAYLHCANGILESKAGAALLGKAGRGSTTRNLATTLKLHGLTKKAG